MKIYTKTGDGGETGLFGGRRVPKDHLRIEAYGTVDELNALLGQARAANGQKEVDELLALLQHHLFVLGADLATPRQGTKASVPRLREEDILQLESRIDAMEETLAPLTSFILPGGTPLAASLHVARTVCRRAERHAVALAHVEDIGPQAIPYLNRLSDLLFVLARFVNHISGTPEVKWSPPSNG